MPDTIPCPFCAEPIRPQASKCRHCGEWLDERGVDTARGRTTVIVDRRRDNTIAAIASFFVPGLGQIVQGRILPALAFFGLAGFAWLIAIASAGVCALIALGVNIWAAVDAARWDE